MYSRSALVKKMQDWVGATQGDALHKKIIDTYNNKKPLARGYKVTYTDAWCATTVSAAFIACGYTAIFPTECGCEAMINLCKTMGIWVENDAYVPKYGDVIFYDWDDTGKGDCTGRSDHVGVVEEVSKNLITVIEGNKSKKVGRRTLEVNGRYIRGYAVPKYDQEPEKQPEEASDEATIWNYLMGKIGNAFGVAGLEGNIKAESNLRANNLQDSYEKKLNITDVEYTALVDGGNYPDFVKDSAGYGICQWTYYTRKQALLEYARSKKTSIGDLQMQLEFLWIELQGYKTVLNGLKNAKSVREASDIVLAQYEKPKNQGEAVKKAREEYGKEFYAKYAGKAQSTPQKAPESIKKVQAKYAAQKYNKSLAGPYKTTACLRLRTGAGTDKAILVEMPKDSLVQNYGYYTDVSGVKWLYVVFTKDGTQYTGFCSSRYLSKQ